jgi:hypothetical protein
MDNKLHTAMVNEAVAALYIVIFSGFGIAALAAICYRLDAIKANVGL